MRSSRSRGVGGDGQRDLDVLDATISCGPRRRLAGGTAAGVARSIQERLQHLRFACRCLHAATALPDLPPAAQGQVGIVQAKRIWADNQAFWEEKATPLAQEIIFASTGTKNPNDPPWKYVAALAGSDIQTNPPATNLATEKSGETFERTVDQLPPSDVLDAIDRMVDEEHLESVLMDEGVRKFADPHKALLELIEAKRTSFGRL